MTRYQELFLTLMPYTTCRSKAGGWVAAGTHVQDVHGEIVYARSVE